MYSSVKLYEHYAAGEFRKFLKVETKQSGFFFSYVYPMPLAYLPALYVLLNLSLHALGLRPLTCDCSVPAFLFLFICKT